MSIIQKILGINKPTKQTINVIQYPERILFETLHQIKNSYWIRASWATFLDLDASDEEIGKAILKHLLLSRQGVKMLSDEEWKDRKEAYKKSTGLKTVKAEMKDALCVTITREENRLEFIPNKNGGTTGNDRGFSFLMNDRIMIDSTQDAGSIGLAYKQALQKCR